MKKDNLLSALLGQAALLLMAAISLVVTSCSQDNEEPGGTLLEGRITLVPTVAPVTAWNAGDANTPNTRVDGTIAASLTGGEIIIMIARDLSSPGKILGSNYFSVSADGKLTRLPFGNRPQEMEAPLSIDVPGEYLVGALGEVSLITDGITYRSSISNNRGQNITIGADGKLVLPLAIGAGGLRLNVKNTDGTAYTGADVTATLKTISQAGGVTAPFDVKTLTAAAPAAIWGDISSSSSVNAGDPLLELATGDKTYRVKAPRQITFSAARLYTFNVRVGATGITVSSDDLGIADFDVQVVTNAEADPVPLYNGAMPNLLAISGQTAYWVAPVDANASIQWGSIDLSAICPAGWHVPTKDEFVAMTGIIEENRPVRTNSDAIEAAFPTGPDNMYYWSSTEKGTSAWMLGVYSDGQLGFYDLPKTNSYQVRCVRAK